MNTRSFALEIMSKCFCRMVFLRKNTDIETGNLEGDPFLGRLFSEKLPIKIGRSEKSHDNAQGRIRRE